MYFGLNNLNKDNNVRLLARDPMRLHWMCLLAAIACIFFTTGAQASLIMPAAKTIDTSELLTSIRNANSAGSSSSSAQTTEQAESPLRLWLDQHQEAAALLGSLNSGASTTSTGSTGPTGNPGSTPMSYCATVASPDLSLTGWASGEARLSLPLPPSNDLLRPPQAT